LGPVWGMGGARDSEKKRKKGGWGGGFQQMKFVGGSGHRILGTEGAG